MQQLFTFLATSMLNRKLLLSIFCLNQRLSTGTFGRRVVVTDADIKPIYTRQKPRKVYKWKQANWDNIKKDGEKLSNRVCGEAKGKADIEKLWNTIIDSINSSVEKKMCHQKPAEINTAYHQSIVD